MDEENAFQALSQIAEATTSPAGVARFLSRVVNGINKGKNDQIYVKSLEQAGDFLITRGVSPEKIQAMLKFRLTDDIKRLLNSSAKIKPKPEFMSGAVGAALSQDNQE